MAGWIIAFLTFMAVGLAIVVLAAIIYFPSSYVSNKVAAKTESKAIGWATFTMCIIVLYAIIRTILFALENGWSPL